MRLSRKPAIGYEYYTRVQCIAVVQKSAFVGRSSQIIGLYDTFCPRRMDMRQCMKLDSFYIYCVSPRDIFQMVEIGDLGYVTEVTFALIERSLF